MIVLRDEQVLAAARRRPGRCEVLEHSASDVSVREDAGRGDPGCSLIQPSSSLRHRAARRLRRESRPDNVARDGWLVRALSVARSQVVVLDAADLIDERPDRTIAAASRSAESTACVHVRPCRSAMPSRSVDANAAQTHCSGSIASTWPARPRSGTARSRRAARSSRVDHPPLLLDERVDPRRLGVEEVGDRALLGIGGSAIADAPESIAEALTAGGTCRPNGCPLDGAIWSSADQTEEPRLELASRWRQRCESQRGNAADGSASRQTTIAGSRDVSRAGFATTRSPSGRSNSRSSSGSTRRGLQSICRAAFVDVDVRASHSTESMSSDARSARSTVAQAAALSTRREVRRVAPGPRCHRGDLAEQSLDLIFKLP